MNIYSPRSTVSSDMTFQIQNLGLMPGPWTYYWTHFEMETQGVNISRTGERLKWDPQVFWDLTRKRNHESRNYSLPKAMLSLWFHSCFLLGVGPSHHSRQIPWGSFAYRCQSILKIEWTLSSRKQKAWNLFTREGDNHLRRKRETVRSSLRMIRVNLSVI